MEWRSFLYGMPLVPFIPRLVIVSKFREATFDLVPEAAADREQHRNFILVLAGFSFTGLLGLAVAPLAITEPASRERLQHLLQLPTYFLLTSFLFYMFALNLQAYKKRWRHDLLGDAIIDAAALSLLSAIVVIVWDASLNVRFTILIAAFAGTIWLTDQVIRVGLSWRIFRDKQKKRKEKKTMSDKDDKAPAMI